MHPDPASTRHSFMIRSDNMSSDDFGALFTRMFGDLYAGMPRPDRQVAIAGVYGRYNGVSVRNLSFRGDLLTGLPDAEDEITFVFPTAGRIVFSHSSEIVGTPRIGLAVEKTAVRSVNFIDGHSQYGMSIRRSIFARRLSVLLGKPILRPIRFHSMVDLAADAFQGIKAIVGMATGNAFDQLMTASSLMPGRLQEMLVDSVLEVWPHTYSDELKRPQALIAPRHVRQAMDYIQAHPDALPSGRELAELSNISLRALQDGFRRFVGTSIVSYQRQVRLQRAHDALTQDPSRSVSEISLALGFSNVGRFCQYFQNAYGISPADLRDGS
ncbi:AraC family transcriptional regulator [Pseudomonas sp. GD04058]|uniref:AraC family transcriptional regulator n=1 Tax=Pseudomonas sp. GD04058 TaxID=2975429 RepID=UPI00244B4199|nr:AraC family transcriptional regulator [Pseudomonas sp. GD04058]MDG9884876.1 AraC family transcriptional regulator [Pseudomonas sp. GD04058]